jgi:hypothetical protein
VFHEDAAAAELGRDGLGRLEDADAAAVAAAGRAVVPLEEPVMRRLLAEACPEGCWSMLPQARPS